MRLAHAAGDELGDLRTEIEDEDGVVLHGAGVGAKKEAILKAEARFVGRALAQPKPRRVKTRPTGHSG
jgi:hypothetical protein